MKSLCKVSLTVSVAMVVGAMMVAVAGGCGGKSGVSGAASKSASRPAPVTLDNSSSKLLLVSLDEAIAKRDYNAIVESFEPKFRGSFKTMLMAAKEYTDDLQSAADLIEKKIGPSEAQHNRQLAQSVYDGMIPSPLAKAVEKGKVNWDRVQLLDEGIATAVMINGAESDFDVQFVLVEEKGKWYVSPRLKGVPADKRQASYVRESKLMTKAFKDYVKLTDDLKKRIKSGEINKENFREKMKELQPAKTAGSGSQPM